MSTNPSVKKTEIALAHDPEGTFIGLITPGARYGFPTEEVPAIIHSMRMAVDGKWGNDCDQRVFPDGDLIGLTDEAARVTGVYGPVFTVERGGAWMMPKHAALQLANEFEALYGKLTGGRS